MTKSQQLKNLINEITGITGKGTGKISHTHEYDIDDDGNGETTSTSEGPDHVHPIKKRVVKKSGEIPHGHPLSEGLSPDFGNTLSQHKDEEEMPGIHQPAGIF